MAVREWRSVHDERPRASTSGGQSFGGRVVLAEEREVLERVLKEAKELQARHLKGDLLVYLL